MEEGDGAPEEGRTILGSDGADESHEVAVQARNDLPGEVGLVLNDPSQPERNSGPLGHINRCDHPLVRVDTPEESQIGPTCGVEVEASRLYPVMNGGHVVESGMPVRIADRDIERA